MVSNKKFRKPKTELVFDNQKREEFLKGFSKRKQQRQKKAKEENEKKLKEERKRIKEEVSSLNDIKSTLSSFISYHL